MICPDCRLPLVKEFKKNGHICVCKEELCEPYGKEIAARIRENAPILAINMIRDLGVPVHIEQNYCFDVVMNNLHNTFNINSR